VTVRPLPARRYPATEEVIALVSGASVIQVKKTPYTVPSRLIGATVTVQLSDAQIDIFLSGTRVLSHARPVYPQDPIPSSTSSQSPMVGGSSGW
jgi:hypothetical protein